MSDDSYPVIREKIEWCRTWVPDCDQAELSIPRVLLIGDSITMGYGPEAAELLKGEASVAWLGTSRFPADPAFMDQLELMFRYDTFDAIHFNNGLHGFDYDEAVYDKLYRSTVKALREMTPGLPWVLVTSTPVRAKTPAADSADVSEFPAPELLPRNARVIQRNETVTSLAQELGLPVNDLYAAMINHPEYVNPDGVHYNDEGKRYQGQVVADCIRQHLIAR
ncbi:SGNH/GDSL hydrolase family protein [Ruficoccus sp. ZRK36]|uniref:SGNH/GDSL hydrolase family protein n=1 Tax=Ruficoccus sp. ZRK36 TaxID=2866311 RepID=UPI001C72DE09|nr:SGNH/GDSL hydrolase family protein [Ruficoccus sp. ZRK36]QYY35966.1 SGNH/GDSL hydrolase family protein [Ruficoccus sp. ZRK36]